MNLQKPGPFRGRQRARTPVRRVCGSARITPCILSVWTRILIVTMTRRSSPKRTGAGGSPSWSRDWACSASWPGPSPVAAETLPGRRRRARSRPARCLPRPIPAPRPPPRLPPPPSRALLGLIPGFLLASSSASAGASAAVPGLVSPGTSGLPTASSSANSKSARSTARANAATSAKPGGRCSSGSVVLSLFSSSRSYPAGQDPEFGVNAVSTAPGTCTFDLSPARLHLVVMSAGRVIWDSADCLRGGGVQLTRLTRGVPVRGVLYLEPRHHPARLRHAGHLGPPGQLCGAGQDDHRDQRDIQLPAGPLSFRAESRAPRPAPGGCPRPAPPR